ncbi:hypothetical protein XENOCAPTIV_011964 [Xenoophorus captivus]|uniref:Uncharacterized protein n=1 Tax=Xenoophorus captivus TaxID=1517983 RepID=A0ABV0QCP3_9TELE
MDSSELTHAVSEDPGWTLFSHLPSELQLFISHDNFLFSLFFFYLEWKGLTGCEFLIANSQDRISCNSNQGHLRWAYASFPPWPTALKASLCCGLPSPVM